MENNFIAENSEILSVITAALLAYSTQSDNKLFVKSFRRVSQSSPVWNAVGIEEVLKSSKV